MVKNFVSRFKYTLMCYRIEHIWLPLGLCILFMLIAGLLLSEYSKAYDAARGFLGFVLPLMAGILAAYAVLEDPVLELQFSTPFYRLIILAERLSLVFMILIFFSALYQIFLALIGIDLSPLGNLFFRQGIWLIPCLSMMMAGSFASLAMAQPAGGAVVTSFLWLFQIIAYGWFVDHPIARKFFLFMGVVAPESPNRLENLICLLVTSTVLLFFSNQLLKNPQRYL